MERAGVTMDYRPLLSVQCACTASGDVGKGVDGEAIHPVTSQRKIRVTDEADWEVQEVAHLRIVSDALWFAARERRDTTYRKIGRRRKLDRLRLCCICARCEVQLSRIEDRYLICRNFKRYQTCTNDRRFQIEEMVDTLHSFILANGKSVWSQ